MKIEKNYADSQVTEGIRSGRDFELVTRYLYKANYQKVHSYIIYNSGTAEDAQDIFQEVIVTFIELEVSRSYPGCQIMNSILRNGLDRAYRPEPVPDEPPVQHENIRGSGYYH